MTIYDKRLISKRELLCYILPKDLQTEYLIIFNLEEGNVMNKALVFIIVLLVISCSTDRDINNIIIGKWYMSKVYELGEDVTEQHNPLNERWVNFKEDGTFESGGKPAEYNAGKWNIDPETGELYLDSDAGEEDDSYWKVSFIEGRMNWQGSKFEFNKRFSIEHERR